MRRRRFLPVAILGFLLFGFFAFRRVGIDPLRLIGGERDTAAPTAPLARADSTCDIEAARIELPAELRETSGIARTASGSLWTHNDGDEARLYRMNEDGSVAQVVALEGTRAVDIEDIDASSCPGGSGECLWLADTGDNDGDRPDVALLIVPVPTADATSVAPTRVRFTWPGGPRDAEALAVLPTGDALLVTKGRGSPIELHRLRVDRTDGTAGAPRQAVHIAQLAAEPEDRRLRVGGAGASEDGRWVAVRTEVGLTVHAAVDLLAGELTPALSHDLRELKETQGEAVDLDASGRVWLTSEGERGTPTLARLRCTLPE